MCMYLSEPFSQCFHFMYFFELKTIKGDKIFLDFFENEISIYEGENFGVKIL